LLFEDGLNVELKEKRKAIWKSFWKLKYRIISYMNKIISIKTKNIENLYPAELEIRNANVVHEKCSNK